MNIRATKRNSVSTESMTLDRLQRAVDEGQLDDETDLSLLADALFAPVWFRLLMHVAPLNTFDARAHVSQLLSGVRATGSEH